jgi:hypothetical protein
LFGGENSGIWPFSRNAFIDGDFKAAPVVRGGNNPLTPVLNPSSQRCLTKFFTGDFAISDRHTPSH